MNFIAQMLGGNKSGSDAAAAAPSNSGNTSGTGTRADGKVSFGFSLMRGKRASMEDFSTAQFRRSPIYNDYVGMFGVFDGHGGPNAADFVRAQLFESLYNNPKFATDLRTAIVEAFIDTDRRYLENDAGAIALSEDHKPNRTDERARIEKEGGVVVWAGTWRVGGVLAVSRAFGDRLLKRYVVAMPDVTVYDLGPTDECVIMATDGLWDVVSNQEAVNMIKETKDAEKAAKRLTDEAFSRGSNDNITCVVLRFSFK